jgi:LacI family transcriptional regulator
MACNDDRAAEIVETCATIGLQVPEEIAVIGVDNDDMVCELANPPISSIFLNEERAGYEAAKLLAQLMAGEKMAGQKIPVHATHIVTRQSTDILKVEDPQIVRALRYIKQNSQRLISVDQVVDATLLSRRVLESRFRRELNRSILSEIRRVRVDTVVRKLIETNMTISQIAIDMGFSDDKHIARMFRKEKGMSPNAYRKKFAAQPSS